MGVSSRREDYLGVLDLRSSNKVCITQDKHLTFLKLNTPDTFMMDLFTYTLNVLENYS